MRAVMQSAILLFAGLLIVAYAQTPQHFVGQWKLISYEQRSPTGEVTQPFGKDPIGRISYNPRGHMSAQLMRRDRSKFANGDPRKGTDAEIRNAFTEYAGYYGSYTVDEKAGTITHHVEGAWFPNWMGTDQVRHFEFNGNRLTLRADLPAGPSILVWERIP